MPGPAGPNAISLQLTLWVGLKSCFVGCLAIFLANYNDKKGVLIYSESYLVECMFKKHTKTKLAQSTCSD